MKLHLLFNLIAIPLLLSQCAKDIATETPVAPKKDFAHQRFTSQESYPKTLAVYQNAKLLVNKEQSVNKIIVNTKQQRLRMLIDGQVALDTPCTTGQSTPKGTFKITEKIRTKRSTLFGSAYLEGKKVCSGDRRNCPHPYSSFVGASIPYWMRLTGDGIGIHASPKIKRVPVSKGCIRLPTNVATTVFYKTGKYTPVLIQ